MSEKELEERVLINKKQYLAIYDFIKTNYPHHKLIHQKNRYFDDDSFTIQKLHNMLRIRSFMNDNSRELTYKVKGSEGDLEYNQKLSFLEFDNMRKNISIPDGEVKQKLLDDGVDLSTLKTIVELRTRRIEVEFDDYILVLDANEYNEIVDYDLEIESKVSIVHAKEIIEKYCKDFSLTYKNDYPTKSSRAFQSIK